MTTPTFAQDMSAGEVRLSGVTNIGQGAEVRVLIDGIEFDPLDEAAVVRRVLGALGKGEGGCLITPNVDILRKMRDPAQAAIARDASIVVADGMPLVWASRLQREPLPGRVAGSDLIWSLTQAAAQDERTVFLLGGSEGVAARAAENLAAATPGLADVQFHFPPFGFEKRPVDNEAIIDAIGNAAPDIVFVGLGFPRQEILMTHLAKQFPSTWFVGCGGSINFVAGEVSRAPVALQKIGMEWAHRLVKEPRRMARRYLLEDAPFAAAMLGRAVRRRLATRRLAQAEA